MGTCEGTCVKVWDGLLRVMKLMGFRVTLPPIQSQSMCSVPSVELCVMHLAASSSVCTVVSGYLVPFWSGLLYLGEVGSSRPD